MLIILSSYLENILGKSSYYWLGVYFSVLFHLTNNEYVMRYTYKRHETVKLLILFVFSRFLSIGKHAIFEGRIHYLSTKVFLNKNLATIILVATELFLGLANSRIQQLFRFKKI